MRFTWKKLRLATLGMFLLGGAGCGAFRGSYSVSPLSFLLPGLVKEDRSVAQPGSNTVANASETVQVASVR